MLYLYCWIVDRVIRRLPQSLSGVRTMDRARETLTRRDQETSWQSDDSDDTTSASDSDVDYSYEPRRLTRDSSNDGSIYT